MSDNSHIDKIFKDGLGEMNFANTDAMWQKMETELDKDGSSKKRPLVFFSLLACLLITGFFTVQYFNKPAIAAAESKTASPTQAANTNSINDKNGSVSTQNISVSNNNPVDVSAAGIAKKTVTTIQESKFVISTSAPEVLNTITEEETNTTATLQQQIGSNDIRLEKVSASADLPVTSSSFSSSISIQPFVNTIATTKAVFKKEIPKTKNITIEAVVGGDLLRLNRKVGFYAGIRLNRHLDNGTVVSFGANYASHTVLDKYRVATKPSSQRSSDARVNSISSIRVPVYLQRQMGNTKFAMMIGLVPTYITSAEVYNVPDSYIGDPNPYRKFTLDDINRFNVLFGAGIKYAAFKQVAFELSGSYGLTGLVKDGYKNLSRVNDNFKSIQLGVAFKLK